MIAMPSRTLPACIDAAKTAALGLERSYDAREETICIGSERRWRDQRDRVWMAYV